MRRIFYPLLVLSGFCAALAPVQAQDAFREPENFYRVYQYDTPLAGWLELNLWNTYMAKSNQEFDHFGEIHGREGLFAQSIEAEYGLTDNLSLAGCADFVDPHGGDFEFAQGRVEARYRFAQRYDWPVNLAVYAEYYFPRHDFSDSQELETRIIADKDFNDLRVALNAIFSKDTTGSEASSQVKMSYAAGVYYRRWLNFQPGLEYYVDFGEIGKIPSFDRQHHEIFATADVRFSPNWLWHVGVGVGLTSKSDELIVKSMLTYEFNAIRPTTLFPRRPVVP